MNSTINDDGLSTMAGPGLVESSVLERVIDKEGSSFFHPNLVSQESDQVFSSTQHLFSAKTNLNLDEESLQKLLAILD